MTRFQVTGGTVDIPLPPKNTAPSEAAARAIEGALGSIRAYHPRALETYTFYEVLDLWLGPWGQNGYPLAYGKYYNIQFTRSQALQQNPDTRRWLERTTVCLQDALIRFSVQRLRQGTLATVTEPELREAAFDSHVQCYIGSGLSIVLIADPFLIPLIGFIPIKEFAPFSGNARASWWQAIQAGVGAPSVAVGYGVALMLPAHSGILSRAARMDARRRTDMLTFSRRLGTLRTQIESGRLDYLPWLNQVIRELDRMELIDPGERRFAREVLLVAQRRRAHVLQRYAREMRDAPPEVRREVERWLRASGAAEQRR